jgi:hypothetical protein
MAFERPLEGLYMDFETPLKAPNFPAQLGTFLW